MDCEQIRACVSRARAGDTEAFGELVRAFQPAVFGIAYGITGDATAAEDIAQDAFVACWTHLDRLRDAEAFPPWLRKTARHLACNWIRSAIYRRRLRERCAAVEQAAPASKTGPGSALEHADGRRRIAEALQVLPPTLREAMVVYYLQERSVSETADALGASEQAVRQRLKRGRDQLRTYFEERWEQQFDEELRHLTPPRVARRFSAALALGVVSPRLARAATRTGLKLALHRTVHERLRLPDWPVAGAALRAFQREPRLALAFPVAALVVLTGLWWNAPAPLEPPPEAPAVSAEKVVSPEPSSEPISPSPIAEAQPETPLIEPIENPPAPEGHTLSGHVFDEDGLPVPGARVTVYTGSYRPLDVSCPVCLNWVAVEAPTYAATTDAEGAFALAGIECDHDLLVTAGAKGLATGLLEYVPLDAVDTDFYLSEALTFEGIVVDAQTGAAIPQYEAKVTCIVTNPEWEHMCQGTDYQWQLFERPDGTFSLNTDRHGLVVVGVRAIGYAAYESPRVGVSSTGVSEPYVIELQPGRTVVGVIVDEHGNPIPMALVTKINEKATQNFAQEDAGHTAAMSGPDGRFELTGVADDDVLNFIAVWHPDYAPGVVPNPPPDEEAIIRLQQPGAIEGTIRNGGQPGGALVVRARVYVDHPYRIYSADAFADKEGRFHVPNLPPGVNTLQVIDRHGEGLLICDIVDVAPGAITPVDIDLSALATVRGVVTGLDAYDDVHLSLRREGAPINFLFQKTLAPTGEFTTHVHDPGLYEVILYEYDRPLEPVLAYPLSVAQGEDIILDLPLPPRPAAEAAESVN